MYQKEFTRIHALLSRSIVALILLALLGTPSASAQEQASTLRQVRNVATQDVGINSPAGIAYSSAADALFVIDISGHKSTNNTTTIHMMSPFEERLGTWTIPVYIDKPINMAYDQRGDRLLLFDSAGGDLISIQTAKSGGLDTSTLTRIEAGRLGAWQPRGLAVDQKSGDVYVLDTAVPQIIRIEPDGDLDLDSAKADRDGRITEIELDELDSADLSGIALNPENEHIYLLNPSEQEVYELTETGELLSTHDLADSGLVNPQAVVFAHSADQTDDAGEISLFVADGSALVVDRPQVPVRNDNDIFLPSITIGDGVLARSFSGTNQNPAGKIVELATSPLRLSPAMLRNATNVVATLVNTTETSGYTPPSPDTSGVTYNSAAGHLILADSEVNEMSIYAGANFFESSLAGVQLDFWNTLPDIEEPTGVVYDPVSGHLYVSDDVAKDLFEIDPGPDTVLGTADDTISTLFHTDTFNSKDPEGITYDTNQKALFWVDGVNNEVYRVTAGTNGVFDGPPPQGDDLLTNFDTSALGVIDPEGITFDASTNHLFISGKSKDTLVETLLDGTFVRSVDFSVVNIDRPAGLAYAPSSVNPNAKSLYVVQRGVDNNNDPNENDGKLFELSFAASTPGNGSPTVNAGADQSVTIASGAALNGTVDDDGLPTEIGVVTVTWSKISGPGTVTFANPNAVDTTANFSVVGVYVLRLNANDGELSTGDDVIVTVTGANGEANLDIQISAGMDDAEERADGSVTLGNGDLEFVEDKGGNQVVGLRFNNITIPTGAIVSNAYIQFKTDETGSSTTALTIEAEATDDAGRFFGRSNDISSRTRTTASVGWSPAPWTTVGEVGPAQQTPSITNILQELVNRPGWSSGNSIAIIISGSGKRTAESFNGDVAGAPMLHIDFIDAGHQPPTVNAGADQAVVINDGAALAGVVTDDGQPDPPGAVTATWSMISGPGTVTFADANLVNTIANFSTVGIYTLRLTGDDGQLTAFDDVVIAVNANHLPPVVNAGLDQEITLPATAILDGTASDDGKPLPANLTTNWSKVSGPGGVVFGDPTALDTVAIIATPGEYVLRLTAFDGELTTTDDVTITVNAFGTGTVVESRVSASTDDAEERATTSVSLGNGDLEFVFDKGGNQTVGMRFNNINVPVGALISNAYIQFKADEKGSTATSLTIQAEAVDNAITFKGAQGNISSRTRTTASASWVPDPWTATGEAGPAQQTSNISAVVQELVDRPGWVDGNSMVFIITGTGERTAESFNGDAAGAPLLHIEYSVAAHQPPTVDAGVDQTIAFPANATLDATVTDDGLPNPPGAVTVSWSKISGPGAVLFTDPSVVDTTASFSAAGTYTLQLTANDGQLVNADQIVVNVLPNHFPPSVEAGAAQTIDISGVATLNGIVTDDGLPNPPGAVTVTWSKASGPGDVTFATPNMVNTTANFSVAGSYILRLTASDGELTSFDNIAITVNGTGIVSILDVRVSASDDDAEERADTTMSRTSSDLEMAFDKGGNQLVGMRFTNLAIPQGSVVTQAWIQFQTDETGSAPTSLTIRGQDADDTLRFLTPSGNISSRPLTSASRNWSPAPWTVKNQAGSDQQTPDIANIINEIVDRPGWVSGNSLVIIVSGTGERTAESYNGSTAAAPLLHVEFIPPAPNNPPSADAGPNQDFVFGSGSPVIPVAMTMAGSSNDDGLPAPPAATSIQWTQISGPGAVTFTDDSSLTTMVMLPTDGTYVLRLTANDGEHSTTDDVTLTVSTTPLP